jgi:CBS domain-containing protein
MARLQKASLPYTALLGDALVLFAKREIGVRKVTCIMVLGEAGELAGILTETDVLRAACSAKNGDIESLPIAPFVKPRNKLLVLTTQEYFSVPIADISCLMGNKQIKHLPVENPETQTPEGVLDSVLAAANLSEALKDDSTARRLALEVQERSTTRPPLFVREDATARAVAEAMLSAATTAAVVHKADDPRGQRFLYGLVTMSDMCVSVCACSVRIPL